MVSLAVFEKAYKANEAYFATLIQNAQKSLGW
jgi:hypothetical protein